jgi:hypothetical protein
MEIGVFALKTVNSIGMYQQQSVLEAATSIANLW